MHNKTKTKHKTSQTIEETIKMNHQQQKHTLEQSKAYVTLKRCSFAWFLSVIELNVLSKAYLGNQQI